MDRLTNEPILGPKLVSFTATWLLLGGIIIAAFKASGGSPLRQLGAAVCATVLLLFDPLVLFTAGKTWNHELPALLLVASVLLHIGALRRGQLLLMALSGAACGLAVGTRLTFVPCLAPLFTLIFFFPVTMRRRFELAALFTAGATIALAPSIYFFLEQRESFLFGNLEFPRLRLLDPENTRIQKTMTVWRKLRYFGKEIVLPSWPIFTAFAAMIIPGVRRYLSGTEPSRSGALTVAWTAAFVVIGCFLPSRYQYQHFFALIPMLVLAIALTGTEVNLPGRKFPFWPLLVAAVAIAQVTLALAHPVKGNEALPDLHDFTHRNEWFPSRAATFGAEIRRNVPAGRILTLAPVWPIAGGLQVYPEFATGPFAWRSARFVAPSRRAPFHIVGPEDLAAFLDAKPPAGILTGVEDEDLEAPFVAYAQERDYELISLSKKRQLWRRKIEPKSAPPARQSLSR